ncbi:hypothetical protein OG21DRAFT_1605804 [Imleria badia]|nr:hypothetical protein OG21DRAFT_1605804 [Imleria badia]
MSTKEAIGAFFSLPSFLLGVSIQHSVTLPQANDRKDAPRLTVHPLAPVLELPNERVHRIPALRLYPPVGYSYPFRYDSETPGLGTLGQLQRIKFCILAYTAPTNTKHAIVFHDSSSTLGPLSLLKPKTLSLITVLEVIRLNSTGGIADVRYDSETPGLGTLGQLQRIKCMNLECLPILMVLSTLLRIPSTPSYSTIRRQLWVHYRSFSPKRSRSSPSSK